MEQRIATNPVTSTRNYINKNTTEMTATTMLSMNASHYKTLTYRRTMAGERVRTHGLNLQVKIASPLIVPNMQKLYFCVETYWVPDNRIWTDADKFYSGQIDSLSMQTIPHRNSIIKIQPAYNYEETTPTTHYISYMDTTLFRDSWISSYIPRIWADTFDSTTPPSLSPTLPQTSVLPLRGFKAIYNDYLRDKRYHTALTEYKDTITTANENNSYEEIGNIASGTTTKGDIIERNFLRVKRLKSYLNDYTIELYNKAIVGTTTPVASSTGLNSYLANSYNDWLERLALSKIEEDKQKNPWEIIAEQGGTRTANDKEVQFLSRKVFPLNMQSVSQTTNDENSDITALGTQGAYSYTNVQLNDIEKLTEYKTNGYVHVIGYVVAETLKESRINRHELNLKYTEIYNPMLKDITDDVLYTAEIRNDDATQQVNAITGYKRKFSEYFSLQSRIMGDFSQKSIYNFTKETTSGINYGTVKYNGKIITNPEYAYNELDTGTNNILKYDYTDLILNKNMAIPEEIVTVANTNATNAQTFLNGHNQLLVGLEETVITELPIDEAIKTNYKAWSEK